MILHHRRVLKYCYSTNQVSSVLIECADNAKIIDVNHSLVPPFEVLILWSKGMEDNWGEALTLIEFKGKGGRVRILRTIH